MAKKATDPFIGDLWDSLIADKLGPAGHETSWTQTPVRIRNRFTRAVRQVMQSGAAFRASAAASGLAGEATKSGRSSRKKSVQEARTQRELLLPLMTNVSSGERPTKKTKR